MLLLSCCFNVEMEWTELVGVWKLILCWKVVTITSILTFSWNLPWHCNIFKGLGLFQLLRWGLSKLGKVSTFVAVSCMQMFALFWYHVNWRLLVTLNNNTPGKRYFPSIILILFCHKRMKVLLTFLFYHLFQNLSTSQHKMFFKRNTNIPKTWKGFKDDFRYWRSFQILAISSVIFHPKHYFSTGLFIFDFNATRNSEM